MDIDSTVQEANIAYPSDAHLMVKMTLLVNKVWMYMKQNIAFFADFIPVRRCPSRQSQGESILVS